MKKLFSFFFVLLFLGLGTASYAQLAPVSPSAMPWPYASETFYYQAPNGHQVPYEIAYAGNGQIFAVFDPATNVNDFNAAYAFAQSAQGPAAENAKLTPLVAPPGWIATGNNVALVRTTADFSVNSGGSGSTLATVPNLGAYVTPNSTYSFRAVLYTVIGAGGSKVDFGGPASPTSVIAQVTAIGGTSIVYSSQATAFLSGPAGSNTTSVTQIIIEGTFTTNNGGTFVIQFAQNSGNAANSTIKAGSTLTVTQIL